MHHIWQARWLWIAAVCGSALGCGGSNDAAQGGPPPTSGDTETPADDVEASAEPPAALQPGRVELRVDGREAPMGAQALLHVREGTPEVHLSLTGAESTTELLIIDVPFTDVENTLGERVLPVGLPDQGASTVNANIDGVYYHSQSGEIQVTMMVGGLVEGSFRVALAPDEGSLQPSQEIGGLPMYVESETAFEITGTFSGSWELSCQSHIPGHSTMRFGGEYCESLPFY